ncbi:uncharacterized protein K02A2.6-like isoform X1 [Alosa alosa]|uniref:uncharacterized protein K02A2.6-like isoform X1 n=1 Tax=Alosa alosa TaxID=278164 RepID=UPI002015465E|nr:uncharacterized protein K02A2.6-like isoform X1 [Alosa alosa]
MASFQIGSIGEYKESDEDFESYLERFDQWIIANAVPSDKKVSTFLSMIGAEAYRLLKNLTSPTKPSTMSYKLLSKALTDHYKPKPMVIAERFRFQRRQQQDGESVADYIVALKQLSTYCEFSGYLDEALRDRFVCGLRTEAIQRRLLTERDLTFKTACDIASSMEMASKNTVEFLEMPNEASEVHKVYSQKTRREQTRRTNPSGSQLDGSLADVSRQPCYRCGGQHAASVCKFKTEKCHHCSKLGHIARVCRNRSKTMRTQYVKQEHRQEDEASDCENELFGVYSVYTATDGTDGIGIVLDIEGSSIQMQLDTGAAVTLVSEKTYKEALTHLPLRQCNLTLTTFTGDVIPLMGQVNVAVKYEAQRQTLPLVVVKGDRPALLGRNWLKRIKLNWANIFAVDNRAGREPEVSALLQRYRSVFDEGPSTICGFKAHIRIKPDAQPIFKKARPLPYALKETVERELDRLEGMGIISKVDRSEWASPLVVVPKADKSIRICGDYSHHQPECGRGVLPTTEYRRPVRNTGRW